MLEGCDLTPLQLVSSASKEPYHRPLQFSISPMPSVGLMSAKYLLVVKVGDGILCRPLLRKSNLSSHSRVL